jgi:hypothetical protein
LGFFADGGEPQALAQRLDFRVALPRSGASPSASFRLASGPGIDGRTPRQSRPAAPF